MDQADFEAFYTRYTADCERAGVDPFERHTVAALVDLIVSGSWQDALCVARAAEPPVGRAGPRV